MTGSSRRLLRRTFRRKGRRSSPHACPGLQGPSDVPRLPPRRSALLCACGGPCKGTLYQAFFSVLLTGAFVSKTTKSEDRCYFIDILSFRVASLRTRGYTSDLTLWIWSFLLDEEDLIVLWARRAR